MLIDLIPMGGRVATNGPSYSGFQATHCLVSELIHSPINDFYFDELEIDLAGLDEWFRLGSCEVSSDGSRISINHVTPEEIAYDVDGEKITLKFYLNGEGLAPGKKSHVEITDTASLVYNPAGPLGLSEMQYKFLWFDDLFTILTDSSFNLSWPHITNCSKNKARYKWFFLRSLSKERAPKGYESPTNFILIRDIFGDIISAWLRKRENYGSGFYLYLGTRRGLQIYSEHEFASLVWGVEALHRKKGGVTTQKKLEAKISRILGKIDNAKDKKWLESKLKHAGEPTLADRIYEVFDAVPIDGIDRKRLRNFATKCANLRNDISHFGSHRHGGAYSSFLNELRKHSEALSKLYHMLILHEIGIEAQIINNWLYNGFRSHRIREALYKAGLLDEAHKDQ